MERVEPLSAGGQPLRQSLRESSQEFNSSQRVLLLTTMYYYIFTTARILIVDWIVSTHRPMTSLQTRRCVDERRTIGGGFVSLCSTA
ncbi:hypothetical protein BDV33DRAFT_167895 [Aspergillus novoparasiticus]|uniref:Uncharacterized protein n=1 Tax=Aspergillus novoparasiticus TaxID=986946 RepID=A0A5N6EZU4_9EURO|nr:hypothetical protein BDV33DRAFT_167895 [Aspergillus novoparasiticus]